MAGNISFNSVPQNARVPLFLLEFSATRNTLNQVNQRTLLIGQSITAVPMEPTYCANFQTAVELFGAKSQIADMVKHYQQTDAIGSLYVLPVSDHSGAVHATGTITISGPATAAGVISLYIGGTLISVPVAAGDADTVIAGNINTAINASFFLPVTSTVATDVVTVTASHGGTIGNGIDIRTNYAGKLGGEATPPGVGVSIVAMASGATDPDISTLDSILGDENFDFVALGFSTTAALNTMRDTMAGRWAFNRQAFGHCFVASKAPGTGAGSAKSAGIANLVTLGHAHNDPHMTIVGYYDSPSAPHQVAAEFCGAFAQSSRADPARPTQTLQLPGIAAPALASRMSWTDKNTLLNSGIALFDVGPGDVCQITRSVTTYQLNAFGVPDQSYLDAETLMTLVYIGRYLKGQVTSKFPRCKLANDGTSFGYGSAVVTPNIIRSELIAGYQSLIDNGVVQDAGDFAKGLIVQRNSNDPTRVDVLYDPYLVVGLRIFAVLAEFSLEAPTA